MNRPLVFAKKLRLPSSQANVLQSLHMAVGLERARARVRLFPGLRAGKGESREDALAKCFLSMGYGDIQVKWDLLSGTSKGVYGMQFRLAVLKAALGDSCSVLFTRDIAEARFLRTLHRILGRPLFYEMHEVLWRQHRDEGNSHWQNTRKDEASILEAASGLICTSDAIARQVAEDFGWTKPILVARNGYSPETFHPLPLFTDENPWPSQNSQTGAQSVQLVYVGNFHPGKGVEVLIQALALLPDQYRLRIIGGSPVGAFEACKDLARRLKLDDRISFTGAVPQSEVRSHCQGAHLFVVPQQSEFYFSPLKLNEAFALGLPVAVTPLPLFEEQRHNGLAYFARDYSAEALATAVEGLAHNENLASQLREKGINEAQKYTWAKRAQNVLDFIDGVLHC